MSNHLATRKVQAIQQLWQAGWSQRRIADVVGVDRKSVRRHVQGSVDHATDEGHKGTCARVREVRRSQVLRRREASAGPGSRQPSVRSSCRALHALIVAGLDHQLTSQRIYRDLVADHGYAGSYWAVNRYVRRLHQKRVGMRPRLPSGESPRDMDSRCDGDTAAPYPSSPFTFSALQGNGTSADVPAEPPAGPTPSCLETQPPPWPPLDPAGGAADKVADHEWECPGDTWRIAGSGRRH